MSKRHRRRGRARIKLGKLRQGREMRCIMRMTGWLRRQIEAGLAKVATSPIIHNGGHYTIEFGGKPIGEYDPSVGGVKWAEPVRHYRFALVGGQLIDLAGT